MDHQAARNEPMPARPLPAWVFSCLFHLGLVVLLAVALHTTPPGAAEQTSRTAGIVLKHSSEEGDLYEGEDQAAESAPQQSTSDQLLAALPNESDASNASEDLPQLPGVGSRATPGGEPNAGEFTDGGPPRALPSGGEARVRVFGVEGVGSKFVYVFDRSSSMEGMPLAAAKGQLIESLQSLESVHQFQIIFFNHEQQIFDITGGGQRIAFATERNKQLATNFVGGISADGGTDRFAALKNAVQLRPDVIFFLTDADDPMPPGELAELERLNRRGQAAICTIQFGRGPQRQPNNFLVALANNSGGQHGYIDITRLGL